MGDDLKNTRWCPAWGELGVGNLKDFRTHIDCPVVVTEANKNECAPSGQLDGKTFPIVCPCECYTCGKTWSADGMPIVRDGKVVRHP
jgi:hypothetical protein